MKRNETIQAVAAILFGRDAAGAPEKGWQAKLARAMSLHKTAIGKTLDLDSSPVFDRKLADVISERRVQMHADLKRLEELEIGLRGSSKDIVRLFEVEHEFTTGRHRLNIYGRDPMELAAHFIGGDFKRAGPAADLRIRALGLRATAELEKSRVSVKPADVSTSMLRDAELEAARKLVALHGVRSSIDRGLWSPGEIKHVDDYTIADLPELRWHFEQALKAAEKTEVGPERSAIVSHSISLRNLISAIERKIGEKK